MSRASVIVRTPNRSKLIKEENMKRNLLALILILSCAGCTDAQKAQIGGFGSKFKVTLYGASGAVIREWKSSGKVATEEHSDGWYFNDSATNKLVRVTGTVVVEQLD
jgi:hypothetical protein